MRKVLTFALAVMLVMAMIGSAFAAETTPAPGTSVRSSQAAYEALPEAVEELPDGVKFYSVYETDQLANEAQKNAFATAQNTLPIVDGMRAQYLFYVNGAGEGTEVQLKLEGANNVIVKSYTTVNGWVNLDSNLGDGVLTFNVQNGSIAIFTN